MERIAAILVLFVLLMNGRHIERRLPVEAQDIVMSATPLPPVEGRTGSGHGGDGTGLRYLGGWRLDARHPSFGGISSMRFGAGGRMLLLNDTGELFSLHFRTGTVRARMRPLPALPGEARLPRWKWDTESIAHDPVSGQIWVGFELTRQICRYGPGLMRVESCAAPPAMQDWPDTTGIESMTRLPDGRFIAIAEEMPANGGGTQGLLFAGDPVDPATPEPVRFSYKPTEGYMPTDILSLGNGLMLVLHRRVTLVDFFTATVSLVDLDSIRPGAVVRGREVLKIKRPMPTDNFEALGLSVEGGQPVLWIASDDNHLPFQRTLLLKYALPPHWLTQYSYRNGEIP